MASMGVNYGHLHVQQKRLKEKSKKMEENALNNNEAGTVKKSIEDGKHSKSKKIYPGGVATFESNENKGES
ncbi:unnamed protein product [Withania somnifera]